MKKAIIRFCKAAVSDALIILIGGMIGKLFGSFVGGILISAATLILSDVSTFIFFKRLAKKAEAETEEIA